MHLPPPTIRTEAFGGAARLAPARRPSPTPSHRGPAGLGPGQATHTLVEHVRLVPQLCVLTQVLPDHLHPLHLQPLQLLPGVAGKGETGHTPEPEPTVWGTLPPHRSQPTLATQHKSPPASNRCQGTPGG